MDFSRSAVIRRSFCRLRRQTDKGILEQVNSERYNLICRLRTHSIILLFLAL